MNSIDSKILSILKKNHRRYILKNIFKYMGRYLFISIIACIIVILISHFVPIVFIYKKMLYVTILIMTVGLFRAFINKPKLQDTAKVIDASGLKERTITALELIDDDNNIYSNMIKEDAYNHLINVDSKRIISFKLDIKKSLYLVVAAMVLIVSIAIPTQHCNDVKKEEQLIKDKEYQKVELQKLIKEIKKDELLKKYDKDLMLKKYEELNRQIDNAKSSKELQKRMDLNKNMMKLNANKFKLEKLDELLKEQRFSEAEELLKDVKKQMQNMNSSSQQSLNKQLASIKNGMSQEQLENMINQMPNGMQMMNDSNAKSGSRKQSSDGNGQGNSNGQGRGTGGQNNAQNGQGRGSGSADNDTDNDRLDVNVVDENVKGQRGKDNYRSEYVERGISVNGTKISYEQVITEYKEKAYQSMNKFHIPKGMEEVVKQYFTGLSE